jgi:hypothetical protein
MAIVRKSSIEYIGLAADSKPITWGGVTVLANAEYYETDTRKSYYFDGVSTWTEQVVTPAAHASSHLSGGSDPLAAATTTARGTVELATSGENATDVVVQGNDARLSDSRTPITHATSHKTGGSDAIKLDELAAPTDVITLNAATGQHGLLKKLDNSANHFMDGQGNWNTIPDGALPSSMAGKTLTTSTITDPIFDNFVDLNRISIPSDPGANKGRIYIKQIDSNNDGIFIKLKKAGAYVEVQIA